MQKLNDVQQTEDDTFRRLKRIPYEEIRGLIVEINRSPFSRAGGAIKKKKLEALTKGGWTVEEYEAERLKLAIESRPAAALRHLRHESKI